MSDRLSVVIPVVQVDMALSLLRTIYGGTVRPVKTIIIDNSVCRFPPFEDAHIIRNRAKMGVNASWNLGVSLSGNCDFVAILNDDIVIDKRMLELLILALRTHSRGYVACPDLTNDLRKVGSTGGPLVVQNMLKREGWAFVIRKDVLDDIPPIPNELKIFFGDDWYMYWTVYRMGGLWLKVKNTKIFHKVGRSILELGVRWRLEVERDIFKKLIMREGYERTIQPIL